MKDSVTGSNSAGYVLGTRVTSAVSSSSMQVFRATDRFSDLSTINLVPTGTSEHSSIAVFRSTDELSYSSAEALVYSVTV